MELVSVKTMMDLVQLPSIESFFTFIDWEKTFFLRCHVKDLITVSKSLIDRFMYKELTHILPVIRFLILEIQSMEGHDSEVQDDIVASLDALNYLQSKAFSLL